MIKLISRLLILLSWSAFVFILLLTPMPVSQGPGPAGFDKVVHIFLFGVLSFLIIYIFKNTSRILLVFMSAFLMASIYATVLEYLQVFVPGRSNSPLDLLAGLLGIILGELIAYVQFVKFKKT